MKHRNRFLFVLSLVAGLLAPNISHSFNIDYPEVTTQGGIYVVAVSGDDSISSVRGAFAKRPVYFNSTGVPGKFEGLMGVDLGAACEMKLFVLTITTKDGRTDTVTRNITVKKGDYAVEHLTLDEKWQSFDAATLARIQRETAAVTALYKKETPKKLWTEPFMLPLVGPTSDGFGLQRIVNNKPSWPHSGLDISADTGTPVATANDGKVALVMDMFFSGLSLFIDHGQGLYTMYFHLSGVLVKEGDTVTKGHTVALVGASGRVTGAHLHFGVRLNNNKVNPIDLINAPVQ